MSGFANEEVIETLRRTVPFWREAVPELADLQPVARIVHDGTDCVRFRAGDEANDGYAFIFDLPVEEAQVLYPEFACCTPHHEAALTRVRRIMAAAFN